MDKELKQLSANVVESVLNLQNHLEDKGLVIGADQDEISKKIETAMSDYPQGQIQLVINCLNAYGDDEVTM